MNDYFGCEVIIMAVLSCVSCVYRADIRERKIPLLLMANKMDLRDALSSVAVRRHIPVILISLLCYILFPF